VENLCHIKGKWASKRFWLLPWQEQLIRDFLGIVKPDGNRQFRTAFVEICKKVGKSELAELALYLLYADNEPSAEVYVAAADRQQASIVFDVAKQIGGDVTGADETVKADGGYQENRQLWQCWILPSAVRGGWR
jgi:phage terminase large subunit-like protein